MIAETFQKVLNLSFNETNRENVRIIEEILPISARFIFHYKGQTKSDYFNLLAKMMAYYCQSDQKDNLRYACVQALEYLVP